MKTLKNKVQLIGNLGADPETRNFDEGKTMVRFSIATSEFYKGSDGKKVDKTQWHNVVAWGNTAVLAQKLLKKGQEIALEGSLNHRVYEDAQGVKKYITEVVAYDFLMLRNAQKAA